MINHGFKTIFHKLAWQDKIYALDLAHKFQHPFTKEFVELVKISLLCADYKSDLFAAKVDRRGQSQMITV